MKKTQKTVAILLAMLLISALSACQNDPPTGPDDHSDWVWVQSDTYGAFSDTGYYYVDDNVLCYADIAVGESTVLCTKVGCSHSTQSCDGYISVLGMTIPMFFYDDHLYYCPAREGVVYSRNATGAELKKVGNLAEKYTKNQQGVEIESCAVADGYLYYQAGISDSVMKDGVTQVTKVMHAIGRINLTTGKDEVLVEEALDKSNEKLVLCAVRGNGILVNRWSGTDVNRSDPGFSDAVKEIPIILEHWNLETGEKTILFEKTRADCIGVNMVEDGKVYFSAKFGQVTDSMRYDFNITYSYDLNTGKEELACPTYTRSHLGGKYVLCRDAETGEYQIYDMEKDQVLPCEVNEPGQLVVKNTFDRGFVVRIIEAEEGEITYNPETVFYYVSHESLADGLQEADLQYIYTF